MSDELDYRDTEQVNRTIAALRQQVDDRDCTIAALREALEHLLIDVANFKSPSGISLGEFIDSARKARKLLSSPNPGVKVAAVVSRCEELFDDEIMNWLPAAQRAEFTRDSLVKLIALYQDVRAINKREESDAQED